jgi:hypothetical protein
MPYIEPISDSLIKKIEPIYKKQKIQDKSFEEGLYEKMKLKLEQKMKSQNSGNYKNQIKRMAEEQSDIKSLQFSPVETHVEISPEFRDEIMREASNLESTKIPAQAPDEEFEILQETSPLEEIEEIVANAKNNIKKAAIDDDDEEEPEYFEETNPLEAEEDEEEVPVGKKTRPSKRGRGGELEEMISPRSETEVGEELSEEVDKLVGKEKSQIADLAGTPSKLKEKLEEEKKHFKNEKRLELIKELAEKAKTRREQQEQGIAEQIKSAPGEEFEILREELPSEEFKDDIAIDEEELDGKDMLDDADEAEEKEEDNTEESSEVSDNEDEEEPKSSDEEGSSEKKKRGRKKGWRPEGTHKENEFLDIDELRLAAYGFKNLKEYGLTPEEVDEIFDVDKATLKHFEKVKKYKPKLKLEDVEEPELWEMAEGEIEKASAKDMNLLFKLIKEANAASAEANVYRKEKEKKPKKPKKPKKGEEDKAEEATEEVKESVQTTVNKAIEKAEKKAEAEKGKMDKLDIPLNDLEVKHAIKYYSVKVDELTREALKQKREIEGLKDKKEEDASDRELAKSILQKEKEEKEKLKDKLKKKRVAPEDMGKYAK